MTEKINNEIMQEFELETAEENEGYVNESKKRKKIAMVIVCFVAIAIMIVLGGLFNTGSKKYELYPGTNIPDFGKYMGIALEYEGNTDTLGKVYRYDIKDVIRVDPTTEKITEYSIMLEDYGYKPIGDMMNVGGNSILFLQGDDCYVKIIGTPLYYGISITKAK